MFWHKLALALGMSVREAMLTITDTEFRNWQAFDRISPIGTERLDNLFALVATVIAQVNAKKGKTFKIEDFIPEWNASGTQSGEDMEKLLMGHAKMYNNNVKHTGT